MASDENSFFGLKVPEGTDRRELYKSQYRAIYTYKMSASELDEAFRTAVTGDGPDGGWSIKNDERVKYVGKLEVSKGDDTTLKVWDARTRKLREDLPGHADEVYAVDWSPDGRHVASAGKDRNLKMWRA